MNSKVIKLNEFERIHNMGYNIVFVYILELPYLFIKIYINIYYIILNILHHKIYV
jgi:hypothetical protein